MTDCLGMHVEDAAVIKIKLYCSNIVTAVAENLTIVITIVTKANERLWYRKQMSVIGVINSLKTLLLLLCFYSPKYLQIHSPWGGLGRVCWAAHYCPAPLESLPYHIIKNANCECFTCCRTFFMIQCIQESNVVKENLLINLMTVCVCVYTCECTCLKK